ncbi:PKD domain-containing protein, partial [Bacteroidota bacterium]
DAIVTVSMPANRYDAATNPDGFQDIVFTMGAGETYALDLSLFIDPLAAPVDELLENKPLTASGINNYGLHITATNMITAYWEIDYEYGSDLWTLKGKNALGTLFFAPFQNRYPTKFQDPTAYSSIDIVATVDGTIVTITLPPGTDASYGSGITTISSAAPPFQVVLNKGQTFSLYPLGYNPAPLARLSSTKIEATEPIAVTLKDDAVRIGPFGEDVVGDQMVPVEILGDNYIIPETKSANMACILAIEDGTDIYITEPDGTPVAGTPYITLAAGEQLLFDIPGGSKFINIRSNSSVGGAFKPFYVYHIATENTSVGGAIVPSIGCTGNTSLAFTRARENKFYFFIVTKQGNQDKFVIDGTPVSELPPNLQVIDAGSFVPIVGSGGWVAFASSNITYNQLSATQHLIENTGGIFHLAIINGKPSAHGRLYYGYYSDFGGLNIGANVAGTTTSITRACYGDPVQLYAFGGTVYDWTPDAYLDDGTSNLPTAYNLPPGVHNYNVEVSGGGCGSGDIDLIILVADPITADFSPDKQTGCSPLEVRYDDHCDSLTYSWTYFMEDDTLRYDLDNLTPYPEPPGYPAPFSFTKTFVNNSDTAQIHQVTLLAKNESGCSDILTRSVVVFPEIISSFLVDTAQGCDPLQVQFQNTSTGNLDRWLWEFGDGGSSTESDPVHLYRNLFGPGDYFHDAELVAISPFNCRDTSTLLITVKPYIEAKFAYDTVAACSPHDIILTDQSIGADIYNWDFGDGNNSNLPGPVLTKLYQNLTADPDTNTIKLVVENFSGCKDSISRDVVIYPEVTADFTPTPADICSPGIITFNNNSVGAFTYLWDFGDGGSSIDPNPTHLYERNNLDHDTTFTVTLVATTDELCSDTMRKVVTIHPYVEAAFTVPDIVGCSPFTININNESFGATEYAWDFGDTNTDNIAA